MSNAKYRTTAEAPTVDVVPVTGISLIAVADVYCTPLPIFACVVLVASSTNPPAAATVDVTVAMVLVPSVRLSVGKPVRAGMASQNPTMDVFGAGALKRTSESVVANEVPAGIVTDPYTHFTVPGYTEGVPCPAATMSLLIVPATAI